MICALEYITAYVLLIWAIYWYAVNQHDFVSDIQTPSRWWFSMGVFLMHEYFGWSRSRTFQSLINIYFPKIIGERVKKFPDIAFFTNFRNYLPWFVKFFSNIFVNLSKSFLELLTFQPETLKYFQNLTDEIVWIYPLPPTPTVVSHDRKEIKVADMILIVY